MSRNIFQYKKCDNAIQGVKCALYLPGYEQLTLQNAVGEAHLSHAAFLETPFRQAMGKLRCGDIRKRDRSPQLNHHQFPHYSGLRDARGTRCVMQTPDPSLAAPNPFYTSQWCEQTNK